MATNQQDQESHDWNVQAPHQEWHHWQTLISETDSNGELHYIFEKPGTYMIGVEEEGYTSTPIESGEALVEKPKEKSSKAYMKSQQKAESLRSMLRVRAES